MAFDLTEAEYRQLARKSILQFINSYIQIVGYVPIDDYDFVPYVSDMLIAIDEQCGEELDVYLPTEEWMTVMMEISIQMLKFWKCAQHPYKLSKDNVELRLKKLAAAPQYGQRTRLWYQQMINMLSASDVSKIIATVGIRNGLIRAKCVGLPEETEEDRKAAAETAVAREMCKEAWGCYLDPGNLTIDSRLWGQRYEPISKKIYTLETGQELVEFGRIPHERVARFGASPDAVECERGFNVEFKSVVSRILDGTIMWEYYCQMQAQMECCDLPWSNFVETKFSEVELLSSLPMNAPMADTVIGAQIEGYMGAIWIVGLEENPSHKYFYVYSPPFRTRKEIELWNKEIVVPDGWRIEGQRHWILEQFVMQGVPRNPRWWADFEPEIEKFWADVDHYREIGCESIAAKPRKSGVVQDKLIACDDGEFDELNTEL